MIRILYVEDDADLRISFRRMYQRNYEVTVAENGLKGLEILRREGFQFDCVVSDIQMPELGGLDLFEKILEENPGFASKVIFTTGGVTKEQARRLDELPNQLLPKPVMPQDFHSAVQAVLV